MSYLKPYDNWRDDFIDMLNYIFNEWVKIITLIPERSKSLIRSIKMAGFKQEGCISKYSNDENYLLFGCTKEELVWL